MAPRSGWRVRDYSSWWSLCSPVAGESGIIALGGHYAPQRVCLLLTMNLIELEVDADGDVNDDKDDDDDYNDDNDDDEDDYNDDDDDDDEVDYTTHDDNDDYDD